jgi:8-oxo-dGTP diphosphatase
MIRERGMGPAELASFGREVIARCRATGARSIVNADPALAAVIGADGVHLPARELMQIAARPPVALCGASCHDARELRRAQALGVDYALVGPVCETPSHPGQPGMGWDAFAGLIAGSPMPVFAIGGMERGDLERAWEAGAHGVAMIRGAWGLTGG